MAEAAEEPQPSNVREGGADAAKASAALSSLDQHNDDDEASNNKSADTEALGKAMANLDVKEPKNQAKKEPPKKIKIDAEDVKLLVQELEVSKVKATEMLRSCEGDAVKALTGYITAPVFPANLEEAIAAG